MRFVDYRHWEHQNDEVRSDREASIGIPVLGDTDACSRNRFVPSSRYRRTLKDGREESGDHVTQDNPQHGIAHNPKGLLDKDSEI